MASGKRILKPGGKRVLTRLGAQVLESLVKLCSKCVECLFQPPVTVCGDHSTCNDPCTGEAAIVGGSIFYRSECCPCPCEGRTDYYTCFRVDLEGVTIQARHNNDDGTYHTFTPTGPFSFSNANCVQTKHTVTWNKYLASDDSFLETGSFDVENQGTSASLYISCPDAGTIDFNAAVVAGAPVGSSVLSTASGDLFSGVHVGDACVGASGALVGNDISIVDDPGTYLITPTCEDCNGDSSPCTTSAGDPPEVCGGTITLTLEYDIGGGMYAMASLDLNGSGCAWAGSGGGASANITTSPVDTHGNACCPDCNCEDCDGDCPNPDQATTPCPGSCWLLTISAGGYSESIIIDPRSCPSGVSGLSGTHIINVSLSSATGCP